MIRLAFILIFAFAPVLKAGAEDSGHQAGYNWAEQKDIDDADDCTGNSSSFIEGCQEYVEENKPKPDDDENNDNDEDNEDNN
jgi:hypothetical protein